MPDEVRPPSEARQVDERDRRTLFQAGLDPAGLAERRSLSALDGHAELAVRTVFDTEDRDLGKTD